MRTKENYLEEINFLKVQMQPLRCKRRSCPQCPSAAGPIQQQHLTSLTGKTPTIPQGLLENYLLSVTPDIQLLVFLTAGLLFCTLAAGLLLAVFLPYCQLHQVLQKQHPAVYVCCDSGEEQSPLQPQAPLRLRSWSQGKSQMQLCPGCLATAFLKNHNIRQIEKTIRLLQSLLPPHLLMCLGVNYSIQRKYFLF